MFRKEMDKQKKLLDGMKEVWENVHAEEIADAYNEILEIMKKLDIYSANMVMTLVYFQTAMKTFEKTVGKGGEQ